MRALIGGLILAAVAVAPATAKDIRTTQGQPFCQERAELAEMLQALVAKDAAWVKALKTCILSKPNIKYVVLEKEDNDVAPKVHVAKVRLITNGESFLGYTIMVDD